MKVVKERRERERAREKEGKKRTETSSPETRQENKTTRNIFDKFSN